MSEVPHKEKKLSKPSKPTDTSWSRRKNYTSNLIIVSTALVMLVSATMLPRLIGLSLPLLPAVLSQSNESSYSSVLTGSTDENCREDPYIMELCRKSSKLFDAVADSMNTFYVRDTHTVGTSYFSKNVYSRQTYVANGYIGARISSLGQGFAYDEINTHTDSTEEEVLLNGWPLFNKRYTGAFVAGFFSLQERLTDTNFPELYANGYDSVISSVPYWANFDLVLNKNGEEFVFSPQTTKQSDVSHYSHNISMNNGVVSTKLIWLDSIQIKIDVLTHKQLLPLGLLNLQIESLDGPVNLTIRDTLNASTSQRTSVKNIGFDEDGTYIEVYPDNVDYSVAAIYSSWDYKNTAKSWVAGGAVVHQDTLVLEPYDKVNLIKYNAIVSTEFDPNSSITELRHAKELVEFAKAKGYEELYNAHNAEWCSQFEETDVSIPSSELLELTARASLYHLLANTQVNSFGLSSAVGVAGLSSDSYGGMVFWDTDIWIIPGIAPFAPKIAKSVLNYRNYTHDQAIENAKFYDYKGAAYPWTSGRFGNCTASGPCVDYEYHINVDIALSSFLLYMVGEDENYLRYTTWPLLRDASDFLSQYTKFDESLGEFVTKNLTDPDEYANHVDNGAFTNSGIDVLLKTTILVAKHLDENINPRWVDVEDKVHIPISKHGVTLEYTGMNASVSIKQADVVLLTFPLDYLEAKEQAVRDLFYYSLKQADMGPAMTFPVFTVAASRLLDYGCSSQSYLRKSVIPYIRSPYIQFSEQADDNVLTNGGTHPAFPFLTAHGGYLQSIVYGVLGLRYSARFCPDTGKFERYLRFDPVKAYTLPGGVQVKGIKYMDQILDITLTDDEGIINHRGDTPILIEVDARNKKAGNYTVNPGQVLKVPAFEPSLNIINSLCECQVIANLTVGSPGEVSLSAIDGNNYTYWQPISRYEPAKLLIDLGADVSISRGYVVWGARPARSISFYIYEGEPVDFDDMLLNFRNQTFKKVLHEYPIEVSEPFDSTYLTEVKLLPNNETSFELNEKVTARYVIFESNDAIDSNGNKGATINEIALFP